MQYLLVGYGLSRFIDDSGSLPSQTILKHTETVPHLAYNTWFRQDKLLFDALANTIDKSLGFLLTRTTTTKQAWDILATTYALPSRGHIKKLKLKLKPSQRNLVHPFIKRGY
ncbi:hypothetical protein RND81_03G059000 [Saponaria officinalis]|uniref:Uncharacterized protein n=1 Tax=Saponaria officinalis TaxID=3572 RepID=A0AAW1M836_SAPOF